MKKLISIFIFSLLFVVDSFATFIYHQNMHAFVFTEDSEMYLSMQSEKYDLSGFGYYINDDPNFYALTEQDIANALLFKDNDVVRFVQKKNNGAILKTNMFEQNGDTLYKIGGTGTGNIVFVANANKYISGQPLPGILYTILIGIAFGSGLLCWKNRKK